MIPLVAVACGGFLAGTVSAAIVMTTRAAVAGSGAFRRGYDIGVQAGFNEGERAGRADALRELRRPVMPIVGRSTGQAAYDAIEKALAQ